MEVLIYLGILNIFLRQGASAACTLPEQFQNSVWIDSDKEELTFSTTNMTGWDFQTSRVSTVYEEWECFHTSNQGSKLYLIMIQTQNITILQDIFTAYLCMELTEITSQSYYYYLLWAEEDKYRDERISTTLASMSVSDPVQQLCFSTSNAAQAAAYPETGEYHVLVKQGSEIAAKQECPSTFFGEYFYTVTNKDTNTDYCGTGNEVWDVCTDYEKMTFNYTVCNTQISYSENGSVFCVFSLTSGSYTYHTVYNEDNNVNPSGGTHRFTCMVSSIASNGSLTVSQTPGSCKKGQTPTDQPVQAYQNTPDGLNMQLTPRTKTDESSSGLSTGAIVGIVFGVLVLIAAVILICLLCKRKKGKQNKKEQENEDVNPVESPRCNKLSVDIDNIPHQRSPLWVNGPQGIAPIETKYNGDHRISKSPVLDKQYNPFSVFPFGKGKKSKQEDTQNGHALTVFQLDGNDNTKEYPLSKEKNIPNDTNLSDSQKLKTITMANNQNSERISIEDLEINKVIPTRPDNYAMPISTPEKSDKDSFQIVQTEINGDTSRNSNVTPKAIVLQTDDNAIYPSHTQLSPHTPKGNCEKQSKETKICSTKIDLNDSEVATLSQRPYKQQSLGLSTANQVREYTITPVLVTERKQKSETPDKVLGDASKNSTTTSGESRHSPKVVKTNVKKKDINVSKIHHSGANDEQPLKKRKKTKITVLSQSKKLSEKSKKPQKSSQNSKPKMKSNKRGDQALNDLIKSKSVGALKNKKGTYYNEDIPIITEPESYLNISEMNNSGICYDDDNEKARALGYWNDDSLAVNETAIFEESRIKTPYDMRLALGSTDDRNESRLTLDTAISPKGTVSARTVSAITSRIDSRGAKYFIENESASIVIQVKAEDVPEDFGVDYLTGDTHTKDDEEHVTFEEDDDEGEDEDYEYEDEDEDIDEFEEANEASKNAVETTMSVLYGTTNGEDDEDPDRMVLTDYEHNLQAIKE